MSLSPSALAYRQMPIHFAAAVAPGATVELTHDLGGRDCTVEEIVARFYPGQQLGLHAEILTAGDQEEHSLIHWPTSANGKTYLSGDDDTYRFAVSEPIIGSAGQYLLIRFLNTDGANTYNGSVDVTVDFAAGALPREAVL